MGKIDFKKEYKELYKPSARDFTYVDIPDFQFLMIDGSGDPNVVVEYQQAIETLYSVAYKIKFVSKKSDKDYVVPPLEGLWWAEDMEQFSIDRKDEWLWTMMIMQPEWITEPMFQDGLSQVTKSKNLPGVSKLRMESYSEGKAIQILYTGPFANEGPVIAAMHRRLHEDGFVKKAKHHEIYLSDPRKTAPDKLKTVIRQPVQAK